ncbi:unnamed protein product [Vicia faba]|uniref:Uncharacterized protein n=1 Tax=Vicia faba TaxID=3906 RepID=A0AAV0ZFP4_VICFA|nr:unnamed protein product [Vicia faba]
MRKADDKYLTHGLKEKKQVVVVVSSMQPMISTSKLYTLKLSATTQASSPHDPVASAQLHFISTTAKPVEVLRSATTKSLRWIVGLKVEYRIWNKAEDKYLTHGLKEKKQVVVVISTMQPMISTSKLYTLKLSTATQASSPHDPVASAQLHFISTTAKPAEVLRSATTKSLRW